MAGKTVRKGKRGKKGEMGILVLQGPLTLARGKEIKKSVESAIEEGGEMEIRFGDVPEADLSFLQTLCAASRTAEERGVRLTIRDEELPDALAGVLEASGFANHRGCPADRCMWPGSRVGCKGAESSE